MSDERDSVCVDAFTVGSGASFQSKDFDFVDAFLFVDTDDDECAAVFFDFSGSSDQSSSLNALAFFDLCGDCFDVDGGASDQSSSLNLDAFAEELERQGFGARPSPRARRPPFRDVCAALSPITSIL